MNAQTDIARLAPLDTDIATLKGRWREQLAQLRALVEDDILPAAFGQEIDTVAGAIDAFTLAVPLVGKFSAGKSSLINTWLGEEIQARDLGPCTHFATEFRYAPVPRIVIHRLADDGAIHTETRPLEDYAALKDSQLPENANIALVELHLTHPALAQHPEIVIVDTPGLSAHDARHTEAVSNYLGDGVMFILCVSPDSTLGLEELAFVNRQRSLGQSFHLLMCKEDLLAPGERDHAMRVLIEQAGLAPEQLARRVSSTKGTLEGFTDILAAIETGKGALFAARFAPAISQLVTQAERLLRQRLAQDIEPDELRARQHALRQGMAQVARSFDDESVDACHDARGPIARAVREDVGNYLRSREDDYADALAAGQDPAATLVADTRNAVQLSAETHLPPRLLQAAERIGEQVGRARTDLDECAISIGDMQLGEAQHDNLGNTLLQLAPLALTKIPTIHPFATAAKVVLPLLIMLFAQSHKEARRKEQARAKAAQAIAQSVQQLDGYLPAALETRTQDFLAALRTQLETRLETDRQNLERLEDELRQSLETRQHMEARLRAALAALTELTPAHA